MSGFTPSALDKINEAVSSLQAFDRMVHDDLSGVMDEMPTLVDLVAFWVSVGCIIAILLMLIISFLVSCLLNRALRRRVVSGEPLPSGLYLVV